MLVSSWVSYLCATLAGGAANPDHTTPSCSPRH